MYVNDTYAYLCKFLKARPHSKRELAEKLDIEESGVDYHFKRLKGRLQWKTSWRVDSNLRPLKIKLFYLEEEK